MRVLHEAGALAAKLRAVWPAHRLTAQARTGTGATRPPSAAAPLDGPAGDFVAGAAAVSGGGGAAVASADGEGGEGVQAPGWPEEVSDAEGDDRLGGDDSARPNAHDQSQDDGELPGGVEAWDRFMAELPLVTAMTLAGLAIAPLEWGSAAPAAALAATPSASDAPASDGAAGSLPVSSGTAADEADPKNLAVAEATIANAATAAEGRTSLDASRARHKGDLRSVLELAGLVQYEDRIGEVGCADVLRERAQDADGAVRIVRDLVEHGVMPEADAGKFVAALRVGSDGGLDASSSDAASSVAASASALPGTAPQWPNLMVQGDVVKAWVLLELVGFQPGQEEELLARMTLSDKRVWLSRRLYREHHGGRMSEEDAILFVECTRDDKKGAILAEIRGHYAEGVGLAADLSGTLEVHFKEENSAGSAVKREWFALASDAMVAPDAGVLISHDRGCTFRPAPMSPGAPEERKTRQLLDLEILGRLLGLALLQQATVGFRLHASVCRLLLRDGEPWDWTHEDVRGLDAQLYQHKVEYVLNNDVEPLCLDFTDVVHDV